MTIGAFIRERREEMGITQTELSFRCRIPQKNISPINSVSDATRHDDVGPLLAESLRRHASLNAYTVVQPSETVRATVLGASTQTVTLSGSTIWAEREILPLKNVPVIRPLLPASLESSAVSNSVSKAAARWDINLAADPFAVALELDRSLDYQLLTQLASGLSSFADTMPTNRPLIVIIERGYAQALAQTVKGLAPFRALLVIDQVGLSEGDYIDIGSPLMDGRVVPLTEEEVTT